MAFQDREEQIGIPDPRVFFAAERTLLAWVRTGITIVALGFVIARFGLFLLLLQAQTELSLPMSLHSWPSSLMGATLAFAGSAIVLGAFYNHRSYINQLPSDDIPPQAFPWLASSLALLVAGVGMLLALYLLIE